MVSTRLAKRSVALLGECLIELSGAPFETLHQAFGGDSLNTAVYLARLARQAIGVDYITVLGADPLSELMMQRWRSEGIGTGLVLRDATRLPGLYWIQVDASGERNFLYWRGESAARYLLQHPNFDCVAASLAEADLVYLTGISLAILPEKDRATLTDLLGRLAARGVAIAFDTNYRPALWLSVEAARAASRALAPIARLMFATFEDEQKLWGDVSPNMTLARLRAQNAQLIVIKLGAGGCLYSEGDKAISVPTSPVTPVTDTTAAGDAFNAGVLAGWLLNRRLEDCCRAGNALAGKVIQQRGAIIRASATPSFEELLAHLACESSGS